MTKQRPAPRDPYAPPGHDVDPYAPVAGFTGERDEARPLVLRYRYAPRLVPMLLAVLFFGVCLGFYVWRAKTNDRGLIINGLIELGEVGATRFFATFAALSAAFVAIGLWAISARLRRPRYLVLDEIALSIPARFARKPRVIPYASIRDVQHLNVQGQSMLSVVTEDGKATIAAIMLASDAQLLEVGAALRGRVRDVARVSEGTRE